MILEPFEEQVAAVVEMIGVEITGELLIVIGIGFDMQPDIISLIITL